MKKKIIIGIGVIVAAVAGYLLYNYLHIKAEKSRLIGEIKAKYFTTGAPDYGKYHEAIHGNMPVTWGNAESYLKTRTIEELESILAGTYYILDHMTSGGLYDHLNVDWTPPQSLHDALNIVLAPAHSLWESLNISPSIASIAAQLPTADINSVIKPKKI